MYISKSFCIIEKKERGDLSHSSGLIYRAREHLVIPSYNLDRDNVYLFKTPHHERLKRDYKVPLWQVALATSAAPTFFKCYKGVDNIRLVDGGVWANNPAMVGLVEGISLFNRSLDKIKILSLGTTDPIKGRTDSLNSGGRIQWCFDAVDIVMRGQSIGVINQIQHLLGEQNFLRVDVNVPDKVFQLDKISGEKLLSHASDESRFQTPKIKELFVDHIAPEFKPLYRLTGEKK